MRRGRGLQQERATTRTRPRAFAPEQPANQESRMTSASATKLANEIVEDLTGSKYYEDPRILARFIQGRTGSDDCSKLAEAILSDWSGAGYYKDPQILADFLESNGVR